MDVDMDTEGDDTKEETCGTPMAKDNLNTMSEGLLRYINTFCRRMPKCEFHAHLSGCISRQMLRTLQQGQRKERFGSEPATDKQSKLLECDRTPRNLQEAFKLFPLIQELVVRPEDVLKVTIEVIREFSEENVVYLELRSTPRKTKYMSKEEYVKALISAVVRAKQLYRNICVRILLSIDRRQTVEEAEETINLALKYVRNSGNIATNKIVIGVEVSGDPKYDARKFLPLLKKVKENLPVISFHLAEMKENLDEVEECLQFGPTRIGHATFVHQIPDEALRNKCLDYLLKNKIPIEICLSSNLICGTIESVETSHLMLYYQNKHPFLISTDDRAMMCCSLSDEYVRAACALNLNPKQLFDLSYSTTKYVSDQLSLDERRFILSKFYNFGKSVRFLGSR